jgi:hypothetical protein
VPCTLIKHQAMLPLNHGATMSKKQNRNSPQAGRTRRFVPRLCAGRYVPTNKNSFGLSLKRILLFALLTASPTHGTTVVPPTISEVVSNSRHVGIVRLVKGEVYEPTDAEGSIPCPYIYSGEWIENYTDDRDSLIRFASKEKFELNSNVLIFLTHKRLPRNIMSTNSRSEHSRLQREKRLENCEETKALPFTIAGTSSTFLDDQYMAEEYRAEKWLSYRSFFHHDLKVTTIYPQSYNVDGQIIERDVFLSEWDSALHNAATTSGYELIVYRAVKWKPYKEKILSLLGE